MNLRISITLEADKSHPSFLLLLSIIKLRPFAPVNVQHQTQRDPSHCRNIKHNHCVLSWEGPQQGTQNRHLREGGFCAPPASQKQPRFLWQDAQSRQLGCCSRAGSTCEGFGASRTARGDYSLGLSNSHGGIIWGKELEPRSSEEFGAESGPAPPKPCFTHSPWGSVSLRHPFCKTRVGGVMPSFPGMQRLLGDIFCCLSGTKHPVISQACSGRRGEARQSAWHSSTGAVSLSGPRSDHRFLPASLARLRTSLLTLRVLSKLNLLHQARGTAGHLPILQEFPSDSGQAGPPEKGSGC